MYPHISIYISVQPTFEDRCGVHYLSCGKNRRGNYAGLCLVRIIIDKPTKSCLTITLVLLQSYEMALCLGRHKSNSHLPDVLRQVEMIKSQMSDRNNSMTDTSPLRKLQTALNSLRSEVKSSYGPTEWSAVRNRI